MTALLITTYLLVQGHENLRLNYKETVLKSIPDVLVIVYQSNPATN